MKSNSSGSTATGALGRLAVEPRERALRLVVAHEPVDAVHLVEGGLDDTGQRAGVFAVGYDCVRAGHGHAGGFVPVERPRGARGRRRRRGQDQRAEEEG